MKRVFAIAGVTWKSAFRYRLFWIMALLLAAAVVGMPMVLRDDGTAKGLTQILVTYTLTAVATLLGLATLWLSCGTLARDIEECQMQVVTVKPIARWQIWLGKWVGILGLNAMLLTLAGAAIFISLQVRAAKLNPDEKKVLNDEIFVARASIKEKAPNLDPIIEANVQRRLAAFHGTPKPADVAEVRKNITEGITAMITEVPAGMWRRWIIDVHTLPQRAQEGAFNIRVKFHASNPNPAATYDTLWVIGPTNSAQKANLVEVLPPDSFQDFKVPPHLVDEHGHLNIDFYNGNDTALTFGLDDGFEVLYYENSFGVNFIRGLAIIFCWLALLAAIGLAAASQLSFPVAAFVSMAILVMGLSNGTLQTVVDQGTITGYNANVTGPTHSPLDYFALPVFRASLHIIKLVEGFSPIDFLSSGRSITWSMLAMAVAQIVLLLGGIFALVGIVLFTRRELATAQGNT